MIRTNARPSMTMMPVMLLAAASVLLATPGSAQRKPPFTARQLLSHPFPWSLVAAPAGGGVAWVFNESGARNVWAALPNANGAFTSMRLTSFTDDDGQDIDHVAWDATGTTIYYTRGGSSGAHDYGPNLTRAVPQNAMSLASGPAEIEVWSVPVAGGTPRKIGAGQAPAPSPKGGLLALLKDDQIWMAAADGSSPPRQAIFDRERSEAITWSPDGSKLAFISTRAAHRIIGIYTIATKQITWVAPTMDNDAEPRWSPDGAKLAFIRTPFGTGGRSGGGRANTEPWSIRVYDVGSGADTPVFVAKRGTGQVFQGFFEGGNLLWAGDRLVFPWEVTGWLRLYSVPSAGGEPIALTADSADVFTAAVSRDGKFVLYGGNEGDLDRRHIFQVAADGSSPRRQLTWGSGIEDRPLGTSGGRVVGFRTDARTPLMPFVLEANGTMRDLAKQAVPAAFPAAKLVEPQLITYRTADGATISAQLSLPNDRGAGKLPAVLFLHGGPGNLQMFPAWDLFDPHSRLYGANQYLTAKGYAVLTINFRRGTGYGFNFRNPEQKPGMPAVEVADILGAVAYLKSRADIDPNRLGIWGASYGARLAALGPVAAPDDFKAVILYEGGGANEAEVATRWRAPTLLIGGDVTGIGGMSALLAAIRARGNVPVENFILPDETHIAMRIATWGKVYESIGDFLDRYLKP